MVKRYNDFNSYLKKQFGCRVQKITIDAGFSCPNRDGTLSTMGCIYCDAHGSGSGAAAQGKSIGDQIRTGKAQLTSRYKAKKFLAYFQAFTNSYAPCDVLKERYDMALADTDIVGLVIGTRPDCIDEEKLKLIEKYAATHMVWIEYGLQSIHNSTLRRINRGHTFEDFVRAVLLTQGRNILICAHVILGLPNETREDILETAEAMAEIGVDGIKTHSLYILKETPLARIFEAGECSVLEQSTYVDWVVAFLEHLSPDVIIQRLTGDPVPSALIAPAWTLQKQQTLSLIHQELEARDTYQGRLYRRG